MKANSKSQSLVNARRRAQRAESPMVASARKILRRKPDGQKDSWADRVMHSLIKIGTKEKKAIVALQAIRMILQQSGSPVPANAVVAIDDFDENPEIAAMSEEEIDARIAELMKTLGSVPSVSAASSQRG